MKTLKLSLFGLACVYIGGCLALSWTVMFGWYEPFCWPYKIVALWIDLFSSPI